MSVIQLLTEVLDLFDVFVVLTPETLEITQTLEDFRIVFAFVTDLGDHVVVGRTTVFLDLNLGSHHCLLLQNAQLMLQVQNMPVNLLFLPIALIKLPLQLNHLLLRFDQIFRIFLYLLL
jgi:hypothetical protein